MKASLATSRDRTAPVAAGLLVCLGAAAILAPLLVAGNPARIDLSLGPTPPGPAHPFGTDLLGRDLLGMSLFGARVSLAVGIAAAALSALLGVVLGTAAAYRGGLLDTAVCRCVDAALALPAFFVLVAVQTLLGPGIANVIVMVALVSWMSTARVARALVMGLKDREFVLAARSLGCPHARILLRHFAPNMAGQLVVLFALGIADALLMESALSFLGMGVPQTVPSWGNMLSNAQAGLISGAWWMAVFPGALILLTALAVNLLGDGLQANLARG